MSSVYREKWERGAKEELSYLIDKKSTYGWTQQDVDRYNCIVEELKD